MVEWHPDRCVLKSGQSFGATKLDVEVPEKDGESRLYYKTGDEADDDGRKNFVVR